MELERFGMWDRGPVDIADGGVRTSRVTRDRWWALPARLAAIAIALCIVVSLLHALQIEIRHAEGYVDVFDQPEPDEQQYWDRARELLEDETDLVIADTIPAERQMFATEEARQWTGSDSAPIRRIVF